MPGRKYLAGSGSYRYGFNGKENDNDVKGQGNQLDYGMRIYDPRLGRFLSVDPLGQSYPWYTPYQFAGNMPIAFIDLDGLEEVKANILIDGKTTIYPLLKPSQWREEDRKSASGSFSSAAAYNTTTLSSSLYQPVDQIHKYYVWAGREVDKQKSNIKFFEAARDVTSFWGVGGAFEGPEWYTGLSTHARQSLADVNSRLLKENMPVIKEILETGGSSLFNGKKGIVWDFEYVNREQSFLTEVIKKDPLSEADRQAINNNFSRFEKNTFFPDHPEYTLAKALLGVKKLDYLPQKQREAIGRSLVFLKHLEIKGFEGSSEYINGLNYLRKEYGGTGATKFLEKLKDMGKIKKD